jgi:hypothetical protein
VRSPLEWGSEPRVTELFAGDAVALTTRQFVFRYRSPADWLGTFRTFYGPTVKAFAALDESEQSTLERELLELAEAHNTSTNGTLRVPSDYLEAVITVA